MIEVKNYVELYELNGKSLTGIRSDKTSLLVESHWNRNEFVILKIGDNDSFTVSASDLISAINNATNSNRL